MLLTMLLRVQPDSREERDRVADRVARADVRRLLLADATSPTRVASPDAMIASLDAPVANKLFVCPSNQYE